VARQLAERTTSSPAHLGQLAVLLDAFDRNNVGLEVARHADNPVQRLRHAEGIAQRKTDNGRADPPAGKHGKERGKEHDQVADELEPNRQPPAPKPRLSLPAMRND
jgi:hypothetical protein